MYFNSLPENIKTSLINLVLPMVLLNFSSPLYLFNCSSAPDFNCWIFSLRAFGDQGVKREAGKKREVGKLGERGEGE